MSLTVGSRIGPYEVQSLLGAGGMGEVFKATDLNLKRAVAIKVLPASVATDVERLARFQREAEVLAALNHPNIAQIHGLEKNASVTALVMEMVEGLTLAERIAQGAIPLDEALQVAKQIADALEAAHEQGIVHRDLKPANVKVRPDGTVKVLDFGLAKTTAPAAVAVTMTAVQAPTITTPATPFDWRSGHPELSRGVTQVGVILGSPAYMAPEQASGKRVDKRADIWAFGVVLWEMLSGRQLFEGETISHVLAAVLTREPDLTTVPPQVRHLLTRCLEKDPRRRLRDIGDAISLVGVADRSLAGGDADVHRFAGTRRSLSLGGWAAAAVLVVALGAVAWLRPATVEREAPVVRFQIGRSPDVYNRTVTAFAVSPDGRLLAYFGAGTDGPQTLLVRTLATGDVREVRGSATAAPVRDSLFWAPDSRQLVRGTASGAQVFDIVAATSRRLCDCRWNGGSWSRDGTILLGGFGAGTGISRLSADDGAPATITTIDAPGSDYDAYPVFLPDGRRFLFTRLTPAGGMATYVGSLDGDEPRRVADGSGRIFVPAAGDRGAYLLGIDGSGLVALPFDPGTASATGVATIVVPGAIAVSASDTGVLAVTTAGSRPRTIPTWMDRKGTRLGQVGEAALIEGLAVAPEGSRLVTAEPAGSDGGGNTMWLRDLVSGARTRLTFNASSAPVWSPDGTTIAFTSQRDGVNRLYQKAADGTGEERPLIKHDRHAWVNDWSSDGRFVIFSTPGAVGVGNDLWSVSTEGVTPGTPTPYLATPSIEQQGQLSPDGRFLAYGSDQSGTWEIYVQPFPSAADGKWMVSNGGGAEPRWSRDGRELFYFSGQTLMAVPVSVRPTFSHGAAVALFEAPILPGYAADSHRWQVAPDGKRFLLLANVGQNDAPPLDVVVNWPALLTK